MIVVKFRSEEIFQDVDSAGISRLLKGGIKRNWICLPSLVGTAHPVHICDRITRTFIGTCKARIVLQKTQRKPQDPVLIYIGCREISPMGES